MMSAAEARANAEVQIMEQQQLQQHASPQTALAQRLQTEKQRTLDLIRSIQASSTTLDLSELDLTPFSGLRPRPVAVLPHSAPPMLRSPPRQVMAVGGGRGGEPVRRLDWETSPSPIRPSQYRPAAVAAPEPEPELEPEPEMELEPEPEPEPEPAPPPRRQEQVSQRLTSPIRQARRGGRPQSEPRPVRTREQQAQEGAAAGKVAARAAAERVSRRKREEQSRASGALAAEKAAMLSEKANVLQKTIEAQGIELSKLRSARINGQEGSRNIRSLLEATKTALEKEREKVDRLEAHNAMLRKEPGSSGGHHEDAGENAAMRKELNRLRRTMGQCREQEEASRRQIVAKVQQEIAQVFERLTESNEQLAAAESERDWYKSAYTNLVAVMKTEMGVAVDAETFVPQAAPAAEDGRWDPVEVTGDAAAADGLTITWSGTANLGVSFVEHAQHPELGVPADCGYAACVGALAEGSPAAGLLQGGQVLRSVGLDDLDGLPYGAAFELVLGAGRPVSLVFGDPANTLSMADAPPAVIAQPEEEEEDTAEQQDESADEDEAAWKRHAEEQAEESSDDEESSSSAAPSSGSSAEFKSQLFSRGGGDL